jgi:hypothetical protein
MFEAKKRMRSRLKAKTQDAGSGVFPEGRGFSPIFYKKTKHMHENDREKYFR